MNGSTRAAWVHVSWAGSLCSHSARATKYSAAAPEIEKPKWSRPPGPTTHSPTTGSPGLTSSTPGPASATSPAHSWPGVTGYRIGMMYRPASSSRSEWQIPTARDRTRTSPGPGAGHSASVTSAWPGAEKTSARMLCFAPSRFP